MSEFYEIGIIGMGPAGIGFAMSMLGTPVLEKTICFERGSSNVDNSCPTSLLKEHSCTNACNIISGVGGASSFSSGKISTYPAGSGLVNFFESETQLKELIDQALSFLNEKVSLTKIKIDPEIKKYAKAFYEQRSIDYKYYDVYEFDGETYRAFLKDTITELRKEGLNLLDSSEVISISRDLYTKEYNINVRTPDGERQYYVRKIVLATGALNIQDRLIENVLNTDADHYEIGVRMEALSHVFGSKLSTHGDLKLKHSKGRTYCVSVNGNIIEYQTGGLRFLEGCVEQSALTQYTNLAVLIKCEDDDLISDFIGRYRDRYKGNPIKQRYIDYINDETSNSDVNTTLASATNGNINCLLPTEINDEIKVFIKDVLIDAMEIPENTITLVAPELKVIRNLKIAENFETINNIFVIGAATGKFRGILQSFCSGIRCGQLLLGR